MDIVDSNKVAYRDPGTKHREGSILFKYLLSGVEGSAQNYEFSIVKTAGRFFGPPHRHNFDQIRFVLSGSFGKSSELKAGQLGYYPEGTPYQIDSGDAEVLLLQFGGSSGHGFMHYEQLRQAHPKLAATGVFEDGIYVRTDPATGKRSKQDGYEAIWEFVHQRAMVYPRPRYLQPILLIPENFAWRPSDDRAQNKLLGCFTERQTRIEMSRLEAGSATMLRAGDTVRLSYVTQGDAFLGDTAIGPGSALRLSAGETAVLKAGTDLQTVDIYLPRFPYSDSLLA